MTSFRTRPSVMSLLAMYVCAIAAHVQPLRADVMKVYWTDRALDKIQRANLDGTAIEDLVTGLSTPLDLKIDIDAGHMYWVDTNTAKIQRANLDGSSVEDIVTGLDLPRGLALTFVPIPISGACCLANGSCLDLTESDCAIGLGSYQRGFHRLWLASLPAATNRRRLLCEQWLPGRYADRVRIGGWQLPG